MKNDALKIFALLCFLANFIFANECKILHVEFVTEFTEFDQTQMELVLNNACGSEVLIAKKLQSYYENQGFLGCEILTKITEQGTLLVEKKLGAAYVWAPAENLDSSGTKLTTFRKLSGLLEGAPVSLLDFERAQKKLSRIGYFEEVAPAQLFRDPQRNRIIPAFFMRDASISEAEALLTYSSENNQFDGQVNINLMNILGTARDLKMEGYSGEFSRHLEMEYKEPWLFGSAWNVLLRGLFNEETLDEDSTKNETLEREILGEVGISREIGFDFLIAVFLGISAEDKHSSLEISYTTLDRFILPRNGFKIDGKISWKIMNSDSLDNHLNAFISATLYKPVYKNFITRFTGSAAGIFPTKGSFKTTDLFSIGGLDLFKGMPYRFLKTRTYGFTEFALLYQDGNNLSFELFYQPGIYRSANVLESWKEEHHYGLGFTQYRKNWSVNLYYALRNKTPFLEGILGFGIKTLF